MGVDLPAWIWLPVQHTQLPLVLRALCMHVRPCDASMCRCTLGCNLVHLDTVSATMKLLIVILHLVGFCFFTTSSARLRREGVGQQPEMDDILKVAQHAHQAADIYFEERKSLPEGRSGRDVYLAVSFALGTWCSWLQIVARAACKANALTRGSLDQGVAAEMAQDGSVVNSCSDCARNYAVACPAVTMPMSVCRVMPKQSLPCQGWATKQVGSACEAPEGYSGSCALELFVGGLTAKEKAQIETRCAEYTLQHLTFRCAM